MLLPHEVRRFRACHLRGGVLNVVAYLLLLYSIAGARGVLAQGLAEGAQINIGVSLPLTGDLQEYGHAVAHGIELARDKFPERFKRLRLSFEDNKYEASPAIAAFRKFRFNKADLIYSWGEPPLSAVAPIAEQERFPLVAMSLDPSPARGKKYVVRSVNSPYEFVVPVLAYLRRHGMKRIGVIKADDPYDNAYVAALQASMEPGEVVSIISNVLPEETDFRAVAIRAQQAHVDVLGMFLYPSQVISLYRAMGTIRFNPPCFGTDVFESARVIEGVGLAMEGAVYSNMATPEWFTREYVAKFGNGDQLSYAFNGYAWAAISGELFSSVLHRPSAEEIVNLYTSVGGREGGVSFRYRDTVDGGRYWEFPALLKVVRNRWVAVLP